MALMHANHASLNARFRRWVKRKPLEEAGASHDIRDAENRKAE
jgi:hypothetical protein